MRNDYIQNAAAVISDPYVLVNVVSRRVKQLRRGYRPLITSLEKLSLEDIALREIAERRISFEIAADEMLDPPSASISTTVAGSARGVRTTFSSRTMLVGAGDKSTP